MRKELVVYFQEVSEHMCKMIQRVFKNDYKILSKTQDEFCYEYVSKNTRVCHKLREEESRHFLSLVPNMRNCALIEVKRANGSEFDIMYFQTEEDEYFLEIDEQEEMDGEVEVSLGIRLDPKQWSFSDLKDVTLMEEEKRRLKVLTTSFMKYVVEKPNYRLRFVTGELFYNTKELDQFLGEGQHDK